MSKHSAIAWTDEQRRAIETVDRNVVVSAAAGSGKTAVLAERCAHLLCDGRHTVDQLLVVTFTESAASEMRTRIARSLRQRLDDSADGRWARRQLSLLDGAQISTLHAFCRTVVADHFTEAGVDPGFTVTDDAEATLLKRETVDAFFDELYGGEEDLAERFRRLVDDYGLGNDETLSDFVLRLHAFTGSLPDAKAWLRQAVECVGPGGIDVVAERREQLRCALRDFVAHAESLAETIRRTAPRWSAYADAMDGDRGEVTAWMESIGIDAGEDALIDVMTRINEHKFPTAPRAAKADVEQDPEGKERCHKMLNDLRDRVRKQIRPKLCLFSLTELREGLEAVSGPTRTLVELTEAFGERYDARKRENALLDFNDLERFALTVLSQDGDLDQPSPVAVALRERFRHVLVDEVQDISPIQDTILGLVGGERDSSAGGRVFAVGDVKQSIYRFRLAQPTIFADRVAAYDDPANARGEVIHLRHNFRSGPHVIAAINRLFDRLMTQEFASITYDENARLMHPAPDGEPPPTGPAVECHLLERELPAASGSDDDDSPATWEVIEREGWCIGQWIQSLTGQEGTSVKYRDIVILLRAPRHTAGHLARMLRRLDIPVYADTAGGYFEAVEIRDVRSLLDVLDNRRQDIPLAAVLRSPVLGPGGGGLTDTDLVAIRSLDRRVPFHEAVVRYADVGDDARLRERVAATLQTLDDYRTAATRQPLADVLWRIFEETGYPAYVASLPGGVQRRANLLKLHEHARQFGRFARQGLHRFLRFLDQLEQEEHELGVAPTISEADNVVRIMSVHKSKGLEFPVVILADLNKGWSRLDTMSDMIFDRDAYVGLRVVEPEQGVKYPSITHQMVAEHSRRESLKEELRLLYVALTRARERLILVGTATADRVARWRSLASDLDGPLPASMLASAGSMLEWIVSALAAQPSGVAAWPDATHAASAPPLFRMHTHAADEIMDWTLPDQASTTQRASLARFAALGPLPDDEPVARDDTLVTTVINRMTAIYAAADMTTMPAVVAASEMKRRFNLLHEADERGRSLVSPPTQWERPAWLDPAAAGPATAADRGTATHLLLEHVDLNRPCTSECLREQCNALIAAGVLSLEQAETALVDAVAWFLASDLGRRLRADPSDVQREVMFVTRVDPKQYDQTADPKDARDVILVRGIIDCLFTTPDGLEIIDYKTDDVSAEQVNERAAGYASQLDMYAHAVASIWHQSVAAKRLVFLTPQVIIPLP